MSERRAKKEASKQARSQPSKEAHSLASRIRPLSPPSLHRRSRRPPLYYETSAKSVIYRRALHAQGEETDRRKHGGRNDGRTMRGESGREQRYIRRRRRRPRRKWKTEETGSKRRRREGGREGGRSGGLSCLSAIAAYITRSSRDGMLTRMAERGRYA